MNELDSFAELANRTKRCSFTITRNVKTRKWRVTLQSRKHFVNKSLIDALNEASAFIVQNRVVNIQSEFEINYVKR